MPIQENFKLTITADSIISTDEQFTIDNINLGDKFKPIDIYFLKSTGEIIKRSYNKREKRTSNQTLPRLAFQIYENEILKLNKNELLSFPICRYEPNKPLYKGIYHSIQEFNEHINTIEYMTYTTSNNKQLVIYCWNIFSTLLFVQECLKRFAKENDQFILIYKEKEKNDDQSKNNTDENINREFLNQMSNTLFKSKNIILRGAPGTGKSYLAKKIATDIVSNGETDNYTELNDEQKKQIEFVQFHPSYDYTDFVEGLRPVTNIDGTMGFELQDGIFKKFCDIARENFEDSQKSKETIKKEQSIENAMYDFLSQDNIHEIPFHIKNGNEFFINSIDETYININIPANNKTNNLNLKINELKAILETDTPINSPKDITTFFDKKYGTQQYSYIFALRDEIIKNINNNDSNEITNNEVKNYVFIIDEINRGEISKIFGELFFSIDPDYRGKIGEVSTQYSNLHINTNEKFYVPENVYIIGTMNDIDRSVDSFDFAMRRRFRYIELKANENTEMLSLLEDEELIDMARKRMTSLNNAILNVDELNENYQIGASYFLKLKNIDFDDLWNDFLKPLLQDYIRGMYNEKEIMQNLESAYYCDIDNER